MKAIRLTKLVIILISTLWLGTGLADRYEDSDHQVTLQAMQTATTADFLAELKEQEREREKEKTKKMVYKYGIIAALIGAKVIFFSRKDR